MSIGASEEDLDVEIKDLKASYGITTPQELRCNIIKEEMSQHHNYVGIQDRKKYRAVLKCQFGFVDIRTINKTILRHCIGNTHHNISNEITSDITKLKLFKLNSWNDIEFTKSCTTYNWVLCPLVHVDIGNMEQYLALTRGNQAPGVVKPKIRGNVNLEIKSQFLRELREDTFFKSKNDDAHEHVEWVLDIVNIFCNGLGTMNRQLLDSQGPIPSMTPAKALAAIQTMADHSQKWNDGLSSRNIDSSSNTKGITAIVRNMEQYLALTRGNQAPGVVKPKIRGNVNLEIKSQFLRELREDTFFKSKNDNAHEHVEWVLDIVNIFCNGLGTMNRQLLDSQGPIPSMTPAKALAAIQTMADHSQKWNDGLSSRNIDSSSNTKGITAILTKEFQAKTVSEVPNSSVGQYKAVYANDEALIDNTSSNETNKVSFIANNKAQEAQEEDDVPTKVLPSQLPPKELNPRSFTLP
nr:hypothetical protein [Tanacetum cinerariifolium]